MSVFSLKLIGSVEVLVTQPQVARILRAAVGFVRPVYLYCEGLDFQGLGDFFDDLSCLRLCRDMIIMKLLYPFCSGPLRGLPFKIC